MASRVGPIDLLIHCAKCGAAVTVRFRDWEPGGPAVEATWACPDCTAENALGAVGTVAWVTKRLQDQMDN